MPAALAQLEPSTQIAARLRDLRSEGVRLDSLIPAAPTPQRLPDLARGWQQYAAHLGRIAYPLAESTQQAQRALDLTRQADDPRPTSQLDLAGALAQFGMFQFEGVPFA